MTRLTQVIPVCNPSDTGYVWGGSAATADNLPYGWPRTAYRFELRFKCLPAYPTCAGNSPANSRHAFESAIHG